MKIAIGVSSGLLVLVGVISLYVYGKGGTYTKNQDYEVEEAWVLPKVLEEVSAVASLDQERMACIQDEEGSIFIYNLTSSELEQEIAFGEGGDYEGLAIHKEDAYVLRSDGLIYWVKGFLEREPQVRVFETELHDIPEVDVEGLCINEAGDGLVLAAKHNSEESEDYKILLELQFQDGDLVESDRLHLSMEDPAFAHLDEDKEDIFSPSAIEIHPTTGDWYLLDARNSLLLITDSEVNPKRLVQLDKGVFPQPEGVTFTPSGELYISTEGGKKPGKIAKLKLRHDG